MRGEAPSSIWSYFQTFVYSEGVALRWQSPMFPSRSRPLRDTGGRPWKVQRVRRAQEEALSDVSERRTGGGGQPMGSLGPVLWLWSWDSQEEIAGPLLGAPIKEDRPKMKNDFKERPEFFFNSFFVWVTFLCIWLCLKDVVGYTLERFFLQKRKKKISEVPETSSSTVAFM